jgi:hypothetical protein
MIQKYENVCYKNMLQIQKILAPTLLILFIHTSVTPKI